MSKAFSIIQKVFGFAVLAVVLLILGTCAWQNCRSDTGLVAPSEAQYKLVVKPNGGTYFTKEKPTVTGSGNKEVYTLTGYWADTKGRYVYHDIVLPLDERIFGIIELSYIGRVNNGN